MKLTGSRAEKFLSEPGDHIIGVLLFGPDRGLVKERSEKLSRKFVTDPEDVFATTILTSDDLQSDPAKLSDEMVAMSLLGDSRLVRIRLDHERPAAALSKSIKAFDSNPERCEARLIIEAGDMTPRSSIRKTFEAAGHFAAIGCYAANPADIANLIRSELSALNISIDRDAVDIWVPLLAGDRSLQKNEIEKIALYKGFGAEDGAVVTREDVLALAAGGQSASIDEIIMASLSGHTQLCDSAFQRAIAGKVNAALILRRLQSHLCRLLEARATIESGESTQSAMRALRPPVFRMQERSFSQHLQLWPSTMLHKALNQTLETEATLKSAGAPVNALTSRLLLALARYARKRR